MKTILAFSICLVYLSAYTCSDAPVRSGTRASLATVAAPAKDSINFTTQVQPILQKHCTPCHFTGGKMYVRMPFDASQTLLSHKEGILKRIKQEDENSLLKQYIDQRSVE